MVSASRWSVALGHIHNVGSRPPGCRSWLGGCNELACGCCRMQMKQRCRPVVIECLWACCQYWRYVPPSFPGTSFQQMVIGRLSVGLSVFSPEISEITGFRWYIHASDFPPKSQTWWDFEPAKMGSKCFMLKVCTERLSFFGGGHIGLQRFVHVQCHVQPLPTKLVFAYFDGGSYKSILSWLNKPQNPGATRSDLRRKAAQSFVRSKLLQLQITHLCSSSATHYTMLQWPKHTKHIHNAMQRQAQHEVISEGRQHKVSSEANCFSCKLPICALHQRHITEHAAPSALASDLRRKAAQSFVRSKLLQLQITHLCSSSATHYTMLQWPKHTKHIHNAMQRQAQHEVISEGRQHKVSSEANCFSCKLPICALHQRHITACSTKCNSKWSQKEGSTKFRQKQNASAANYPFVLFISDTLHHAPMTQAHQARSLLLHCTMPCSTKGNNKQPNMANMCPKITTPVDIPCLIYWNRYSIRNLIVFHQPCINHNLSFGGFFL